MAQTIPVALFLPPAGPSRAEGWMSRARLAACQDIIARLQSIGTAGPIVALAAEPEDRASLAAMGVELVEPPEQAGAFHFGKALAAIAESLGAGALAYFGGASAPLVSADRLEQVIDQAVRAREPTAWVNNALSTDWVVLSASHGLKEIAARLVTDNPLGWILQREAGYRVIALPPCAENLADIDTPTDVVLLARHSQLGEALKAFLDGAAESNLLEKVDALRRVIRTPASTLAIIGRSSSAVWREIERRKQVWVRLFVEERGMLASGRAERGEVRSLIGELLDDWGPDRFVERLAAMADGLLWDNRVWMAHRGLWPSAADRFASDLGWAEEVSDAVLAALTRALRQARIPILTGGHSLVSGSLMALLESLPPPDAG